MKISAEKPANPPKTLSAEAKTWWKKLVKEYEIDDPAGCLMLQTALEALDRMRGAQQAIADDGVTIKDRFDQVRAHPMITVERAARAAMMAALKALNLDLEPLRDRVGRPAGSWGKT